MNSRGNGRCRLLVLLVTATLGLAACQTTSPLPIIVTPVAIPVEGSTLRRLDACPSDLVRTDKVIRVRIPGNVFGSAFSRHVKVHRKAADEGVNDDEKPADPGNNNEVVGDGPKHEPFHIYLSNIGLTSDDVGHYVMIRLILKNKNDFQFASLDLGVKGNTLDDAAGIAVTAPIGEGLLCGDSRYVQTGDRQVFVFFVKVTAPGEVAIDDYNIILQRSGTTETPVIVDPKIRNNG